jgi:hypothetical protein
MLYRASLFEVYNDDVNYAYISFLKPILGDIQRVNKAFEEKKKLIQQNY